MIVVCSGTSRAKRTSKSHHRSTMGKRIWQPLTHQAEKFGYDVTIQPSVRPSVRPPLQTLGKEEGNLIKTLTEELKIPSFLGGIKEKKSHYQISLLRPQLYDLGDPRQPFPRGNVIECLYVKT